MASTWWEVVTWSDLPAPVAVLSQTADHVTMEYSPGKTRRRLKRGLAKYFATRSEAWSEIVNRTEDKVFALERDLQKAKDKLEKARQQCRIEDTSS